MRYFAYGSNMDPEQMAGRCPGARALGAALLAGYRLTFTYDSIFWGGGVGSVEVAPGEEVWGVLWEIDEAGEAALDRYEGVAKDVYRKEWLEVVHEDARVRALVYLCNHTRYRQPSRRYLRPMLEAADRFGFPDHYRARLNGLLEGR